MVEPLLSGYVDGELASNQLRRVEDHLSQCASCAQQLSDLQSLHTALSADGLYHSAPGTLRSRVESVLSVKEPVSALYQPVTAKSLSVVVVSLLLLAGVTGVVWWTWFSKPLSVAEQTVLSYVRAKDANRMTEVSSADARVVSTWLAGKGHATLTIPDLSKKGLTLLGARMEKTGGQSIPVLVYSSGGSTVNLYQWPSSCGGEQSTCTTSLQGYRLVNWVDAGMTHWMVSDLPAERLEEFAQLMRGK